MECMTPEEIQWQERVNTGTAWTNNESFEKNGYLVLKNLWDPEELYHPVPEERGQIKYFGSVNCYEYFPEETQVNGSLARYSHPMYKKIHSGIRMKLEKEIGRKLYNTYYYDRYYFTGQELKKHLDRDACEISVTIHVSTNIKESWPICIKTPDTYVDKKKSQILIPGRESCITLEAGDGMVYKGCERPHWRDPMPGKTKKVFGKGEELYYHQIFFHYVLQDGQRAHCAWDRAR